MLNTRRSRLAAIAMLGALASACGTSTEPDVLEQLDTDAAMADYEALGAVLGSAEFAGFQALGNRTPFGGGPAAIEVVGGISAAQSRDGNRAFALELFGRLEAAGAGDRPAAAPIISDTHRGATFVYDPEADDYAVDPDREGAPTTGVRFITYEVDTAGFPIVEQETGYADLIDEGDGSAEDIVLRLVVVHDTETVLDYRTTLDETATGGALTVRGFMTGEGVRLDFDIEATGTDDAGVETLDVSWDLRVEQRDFSITGSVSGIHEPDDGNGEIKVTVRHRLASIEVDVKGTNGIMDGSIFLNGELFATVTGPEDEPTILGAGGEPLTLGELFVLRHIFDTIEDVFDFLEDLLDPVDELVVLGIIL